MAGCCTPRRTADHATRPRAGPQSSGPAAVWRDVRVLRWLFQLVVLGVVVAMLAWLYSNYRTNVERTNIPTDFSFLDRPSNFEIPGNSMSSTAPVRNAFVQGFLNTMRVAVAGLVLATVLGTLIGIGRLSHNAVLRTLCRVYVEVVRNIPLLVILLFANLGLVLQVLPRIENAWQPLGISVFSNRGIAIPWFVGSGWGLIALVVVAAVAAVSSSDGGARCSTAPARQRAPLRGRLPWWWSSWSADGWRSGTTRRRPRSPVD